jgi:hypothetical protein
MNRSFFLLLTLFFYSNAYAHCPGHFKLESACLMLDQNLVYIYNQKFEHNGPYQDLKDYKISAIKNAGKNFEFSKKARGIYEIKSEKKLVDIEIELTNKKNKTVLKLKQE